MPSRNANTNSRRTTKTSRFFARSGNVKKTKLPSKSIGKTPDQIKGRIIKNREVQIQASKATPAIVSTTTEDAESSPLRDDAGSSSCKDVVSMSARGSDLCVTTEVALHDGSVSYATEKQPAAEEVRELAGCEFGVDLSTVEEGLSEANTVHDCVGSDALELCNEHDTGVECDDDDDKDDGNRSVEAGLSTQIAQPPQLEPHKSPTRSKSSSPRKPPAKLSPYFPKPLPIIESSCLPFPPISATTFGLIQEQLALSPFRLLIATIFLNRTRGPVAIPVLFELFARYPTIQDMAGARHEDIVSVIRNLGFQNQRATKFIALAQKWLQYPPQRGRRYRKLNYPCKRDGADIAPDEVIPDEDDDEDDDDADNDAIGINDGDEQKQWERPRKVAWEIAHLPGVGAYAIDSWRIFCRDRLRFPTEESGLPESTSSSPIKDSNQRLNSVQSECPQIYEPEWKRVLPQDKELRAYLSWKWLKEGWVWNCENGDKKKADPEMMKRAEKGGLAIEGGDGHLILMNMSADMMNIRENEFIKKAGFSLDYIS